MKYYADVNNNYLAKYLDSEVLKHFTSSWFFYDHAGEFRLAEVLDIDVTVFSFLWEYSDTALVEKIDQWKRALKRNNIEVPSNIKFRYKDYLSPENKVYLDIAETDCKAADKAFKDFSVFNTAKNLTQFIVDKNIHVEDLDLSFLDIDDPLTRLKNCIKMTDSKWLRAVVLNGYHHRGDLIKVLIHKKEECFLPEEHQLEYEVFENIYVANSLCWK